MLVVLERRCWAEARTLTLPHLEVDELRVSFPLGRKSIFSRAEIPHLEAVAGVSFAVQRGETLALVGESGCGKSTTARAVVRICHISGGRVMFDGQDLTAMGARELQPVRRKLQMVFQDPFSSLNPRMLVRDLIQEPLVVHGLGSRRERPARVKDLLQRVGLDYRMGERYPHEFSGGQRQRIAIARALASQPEIVVLDEPLSALDVSVQAQIVNMLGELQDQEELTYLFISHDMAVVEAFSDFVGVMYLGVIVEYAPVEELFARPMHPYTTALLSAVPIADPVRERNRSRVILRGDVPSPVDPPMGCRFHTRCPYVQPTRCHDEIPRLRSVGSGHSAACHWIEEIEAGRIHPVEPNRAVRGLAV